MLAAICRQPLGLLTDLYELTMAYGYWKLKKADDEAVFHLVFRNPPFAGGYTIACGLQHVIDFLKAYRFDRADLFQTLIATKAARICEAAGGPVLHALQLLPDSPNAADNACYGGGRQRSRLGNRGNRWFAIKWRPRRQAGSSG